MQNDQEKTRYILYARKSSESEERQVQSIEDQIVTMKSYAERLNLNVVEVISEAYSAKTPGARPKFKLLLDKIKRAEANGILCWQFNRLSRNPIDGGELAWLLQTGALACIQTHDRHYGPNDNALIIAIENGMATQFIQDLKKNSMRGMLGKAERGWSPTRAPLGYLNRDLKLVRDEERFNIVRKMWDMLLTGAYTPPQILKVATEQWGLRTPKWKNSGGREVTKSGIYRIFSNLFYTGDFEWNGKRYKGIHEPMITRDEFDRAQKIIGRDGKPRSQKYFHSYTGAIRCGECGCLHTALLKRKLIKKTGLYKDFVYYYCTRRKKDIVCSQRATLTEQELESQIARIIEGINIAPEFLQWALDYLRENNEIEVEDKEKIKENLRATLSKKKKELSRLTDLFCMEQIEESLYAEKRDAIQESIKNLERELSPSEDHNQKVVELTQKTFEFAAYAHKAFIAPNADPMLKREIFLALGKNHSITGQILRIEPYEWLEPIKSSYPALKAQYDALELGIREGSARTEALAQIRTTWGA